MGWARVLCDTHWILFFYKGGKLSVLKKKTEPPLLTQQQEVFHTRCLDPEEALKAWARCVDTTGQVPLAIQRTVFPQVEDVLP